MLHRFLFVAGMTVGIMVPLVWATYVSRPASHTPAAKTAEAASPSQMSARAPTEDVTASVPTAPAATTASPETAQTASPSKPADEIAQSPAKATAKAVRSHAATVLAAQRPKDRTLPAVVDSYNGAHIITICAALSEDEQLRAGCP